MHSVRTACCAAFVASVALFAPAIGAAQCPDGSAPPCRAAAPRPAPPGSSVAVLYFENASRDSADAYLAHGLTEAIIVRLGRIGRLRVTSRSAVRSLPPADPAAAGRRLGVAHLVTGSVRRSGSRLRVTVDLVRTSTGVQLWAEQYDRTSGDVLALEEDIAEAVAAAIVGRLAPADLETLGVRPTRSAEAYDHFLRGNYHLAERSQRGTQQAIAEYGAAVRTDPSFTAALARVGYAHAIAMGWEWDLGVPAESLLARGFVAVDEALRRDSTAADAWLTRGLLLMSRRPVTFDGVAEALDRAVTLDPAGAEAHHLIGLTRFARGDEAGAAVAWQRALALEPARAVTRYYMARTAYGARRYAETVALADTALSGDPRFHVAFALRGAALARLGDTARARQDVEAAFRLSDPGFALHVAHVSAALLEAGDTAALRRRARALEAADRPTTSGALALSAVLGQLGEIDRAVALLERIGEVTPGPPFRWAFLQEPDWDTLRASPRFQAFLDRIRPRAGAEGSR